MTVAQQPPPQVCLHAACSRSSQQAQIQMSIEACATGRLCRTRGLLDLQLPKQRRPSIQDEGTPGKASFEHSGKMRGGDKGAVCKSAGEASSARL